MIPFDKAHKAVHYPDDRRFRIWMRPSALLLLSAIIVTPIVAAWVQGALFGLPHILANAASMEGAASGPHGFPAWIRWSHFFNLFFVFMLMRSGLSILVDHPRLYWNDHCTPGSEWIRFTPLRVPKDRVWTAKDDARYMSPLVSTPGYRHTVLAPA
jgi:methionine sulfoxide reductase catalytic subunit